MRDTDWNAPWFAAVRAAGEALDWTDPLAALNARAAGRVTGQGRPLRFVDAAAVDAPVYEAHIAATGEVPTRLQDEGGVHDAFNALVWLAFPRAKAALNAVQAQELARAGVRPVRGSLRDAATLFDENALLLPHCDTAVVDALRARRWTEGLHARRADWGRCIDAMVFGHALMQKLRAPWRAVTAHAWPVRVSPEWFGLPPAARIDALDAAAAACLPALLADRAARLPLPVLGVPGWWPDNAQAHFYDDAAVFRPPRPSTESVTRHVG